MTATQNPWSNPIHTSKTGARISSAIPGGNCKRIGRKAVTVAAIVNPDGVAVLNAEVGQEGQPLPAAANLRELLARPAFLQLIAIYRDQGRNLEDALAKLRQLILAALVRPTPRRRTTHRQQLASSHAPGQHPPPFFFLPPPAGPAARGGGDALLDFTVAPEK